MTLVKQIRAGTKILFYHFRFYGPINPCFLRWLIPADLFGLWTVYEGDDFLQSTTTMGPTVNQSWQDDIYNDNRILRANSFLVDVSARLWSFESMKLQTFDLEEPIPILERILSQQRACLHGGRCLLEIYRVHCGIIFRLRTRYQWKLVLQRFAKPSAVHKRFRDWEEMGMIKRFFDVFVRICDHHEEIDWEWISIDSATTKAPMGAIDAGPNPTNRGKKESKPHILANSCGAPVTVKISAANTHDSQLVGDIIDKLLEYFLDILRRYPINLCLDKAYDFKAIAEELQEREFTPYTRRRREAKDVGLKKRRPRNWILERTNIWLYIFTGLLIRREHQGQGHRGLVLLASVLIMLGMVAGPL